MVFVMLESRVRRAALEILIAGPGTSWIWLARVFPRCMLLGVCSGADIKTFEPVRFGILLGGNGCGFRSSAPFPVPVRTPPVKHGRAVPSPIASKTPGLTRFRFNASQPCAEKSNCLFEDLIWLTIADSGTPPFTKLMTSAFLSVAARDFAGKSCPGVLLVLE